MARLLHLDAEQDPGPDLLTGDLSAIRGGFVAAWQDADGTTRLARDPIGHRSLYYARDPGGALCSAPDPVLALHRSGGRLVVDREALAFYLSCAYVPGTRTLLSGVQAVGPGERVVLEQGQIRRQLYWTLPPSPPEPAPAPVLRQRLRSTLEDAIRLRLPAPDAPLAASLSGGIDSSAVVGLLRSLHPGPLTAFSIHFGAGLPNELAWSERMAGQAGAGHRPLEIRPDAVAESFDTTVRALGEPNGDPLTVPNLLLFREARDSCDRLFNGEGGDPCFGGPKNAPMLLAALVGAGGSLAESYLLAHGRCYEDLDAMGLGDQRPALLETVAPWFSDPRWPGLLDRLMAINVSWKGAWHILPKVEQLGRSQGVQPCSPLFDRDVVELAFAIPGPLKRAGADEKHLLKAAVADLVPKEIRDRPKSGMMVPVEAWFAPRGPLYGFARDRLLDGLARWDLIDRRWLERLVEGRQGGLRPRRGIKIWLLLTLESWLRQAKERAEEGVNDRAAS